MEKRFQKRVKDLELQNEKNSRQLEDLYRLTGREIHEKHPGFNKEESASLLSDIDTYIQRISSYREERKQLEAAIQYDKLTRRIHDLREELESEEKAIVTHRANTEKLKKTIGETEEERQALEMRKPGE